MPNPHEKRIFSWMKKTQDKELKVKNKKSEQRNHTKGAIWLELRPEWIGHYSQNIKEMEAKLEMPWEGDDYFFIDLIFSQKIKQKIFIE